MRRPKGYMRPREFDMVLDNVGRQVDTLLLYYMGEPLLNPDIGSMVESAAKRGIYTAICTNGEVDAHSLVAAGAGEISFQIGGVGQVAHETYRVGGHYERVLGNIRRTIEAKQWTRPLTKVIVGFIVMRHNEHQVADARKYFKELGADQVNIISPCVRNLRQARQFMPQDPAYWFYDRDAYFRNAVLRPKKVPRNRCWWIYFSTVVCWNGDVVPCCRDAQGEHTMGNALNEDFKGIWNRERYREFRRAIREQQDKMGICRLCSGYLPPVPGIHR